MKKIYLLLSIVVLGMLTSCMKDQEDIFDKSSALRADEAIAADYKILASAGNGWLMKYYPSPYLTYGGFNMFLKFTEDGKVTVAGEKYFTGTNAATVQSYYQLKQSAGIVLSFDTYNDIFHLFSDPSAPLVGETGKGMEGDYDFQIISATETEVVLKGKKTGNYAVMTPATSADWEGYFDTIGDVEDNMSYNKYTMDINGTTVTVVPTYRNFAMTYAKNEQDTTINVPYTINPQGIEFYEPIVIEGQTLTGFSNAAAGALSFPSIDNPSITLDVYIAPLNETFMTSDWYIAYSQMGAFAQPYLNIMKAVSDGEGETITLMAFTNINGYLSFYFTSSPYSGYICFETELIGDDMIKMYFDGKDDGGNGNWYLTHGYINGLVPFGEDADHARTFKLTTDNPLSPSYITLTDQNEPTNVMTLSATPISNPFSH